MNNCKTIRTQIEETTLGDDYGQLLRDHLVQCDGCRQFEGEQRKLRKLVGSLGTVQAPADFDFNLRVRMAHASDNGTSGSRWFLNPVFAAAALVLFVGLVAGTAYLNRRPPTETAKTGAPSAISVPAQTPQPNPDSSVAFKPTEERKEKGTQPSEGRRDGVKRNAEQRNVIAYKPKRTIVAADFSQTVAPTFGSTTQSNSPRVFPIDASLNSMKVSLDDGQGNARTISLPGISFGSQRVTGNQYAQKGVL